MTLHRILSLSGRHRIYILTSNERHRIYILTSNERHRIYILTSYDITQDTKFERETQDISKD